VRVGAAGRIRGLVIKDIAELWRNPGAMVPGIAMGLAALVPAFLVAVAAPRLSGETLADASEFADAAHRAMDTIPELRTLEPGALVQAFLFHQFGFLLLLVPIVGAMALAAHAVIGEKTARTLEPLLATPLSTGELLAAKTLTPFAFACGVLLTSVALYLGGIALLGEPEVWRTFVTVRAATLFLVLGPLLALVSLLLSVIVSSRVSDPRSAQQLSALVVTPITAVFIAQLIGEYLVSRRTLLLAAAGLAIVAVVLLGIGIRIFARERILMRWK
jgi:ABC-2 type transport system permease protein